MKKSINLCVIIAGLLFVLYGAYVFIPNHIVMGLLPEQIQVSGVVDSHVGLKTPSTAGLFYLDDDTADKIEKEGLKFFENQPHSRSKPSLVYEKWRATPYDMPEGDFPGDMAHRPWDDEIYKYALREGGFYTTSGGTASIFVFPKLKLVACYRFN